MIAFISCEKELANSYQNEINQMPIIGSICGEIEQKDIIDDQGNAIGLALLYNDTKNFYLYLSLSDSLIVEQTNLHWSQELMNFPMDSFHNLDLGNFKFTKREVLPRNSQKIIIPLPQLPSRFYLAAGITFKNYKNSASGKNIAWIDGIRYGSSYRGKVTAFERKICLTQQGSTMPD
jgi:hypothetical protein